MTAIARTVHLAGSVLGDFKGRAGGFPLTRLVAHSECEIGERPLQRDMEHPM